MSDRAMTERAASLLAEAMKLTEGERVGLVEGLLESLDPPAGNIDRMTDDELAAELDRRAEEVRRDPSAAIPWDAVKDMR